VLRFLTQHSVERMRASAAKTFADAFRLRTTPRSGGNEDA
jgi:hypothetical protein